MDNKTLKLIAEKLIGLAKLKIQLSQGTLIKPQAAIVYSSGEVDLRLIDVAKGLSEYAKVTGVARSRNAAYVILISNVVFRLPLGALLVEVINPNNLVEMSFTTDYNKKGNSFIFQRSIWNERENKEGVLLPWAVTV